MSETPNGANATAEVANAAPAHSLVSANAEPEHDDDDGETRLSPGELRRMGRRMAKYAERARVAEEKLKEIEGAELHKAHEKLKAENAALREFKANADRKEAEQAREAIRNRNADAVLSDVKQERREEIEVLLAGMQALGKIDLYLEAEGAGLKLREMLGKDHPDWFTDAPNGAIAGLPGLPGQGLPQGPVIGMTPEQYMQLSEEQRIKLFERKPHKGANP